MTFKLFIRPFEKVFIQSFKCIIHQQSHSFQLKNNQIKNRNIYQILLYSSLKDESTCSSSINDSTSIELSSLNVNIGPAYETDKSCEDFQDFILASRNKDFETAMKIYL